jgi:hypothetical protein
MKRVILLAVSILLICSSYSLAAVPCKINYQGRLIKDNVPVNGTVNMEFKLYNQATTGTLIKTITINNVQVFNGLFRALLDLGDVDWTAGETIYLEVKAGTDTLSPREPIYAYPYAINTHYLEGKTTAHFLDVSSSTQTKQGGLNIMGKVGIGDDSPQSPLTVGSGDAFQVNSSGDPIKIKNVTYSWPSAQGGLNTVLTNNGSGTLIWTTPDPWTYVVLGFDFSTISVPAGAVDVTGLAFTPSANTKYEFEAILMIRTAAVATNPRVGLAWATGMTDGVAWIYESQTATTQLMAFGNINDELLIAGGSLPNATQSWPVDVKGMVVAGAAPSGNVRIQLASETSGASVTMKAGSFIKYRIYK